MRGGILSKNNSWLYNQSNKCDAIKKNRKKKRKDRKEERKDNWTWEMVIKEKEIKEREINKIQNKPFTSKGANSFSFIPNLLIIDLKWK